MKDEQGSRIELNSRVEVGDGKVNSNKVENNKVTKEKNYQKMSKSKKTIKSLDFFTFGTRLMFTKLR